jgi:hypothetical protein
VLVCQRFMEVSCSVCFAAGGIARGTLIRRSS